MKRNAKQIVPDLDTRFKGGAKTFINKGTNGRWRSVLTSDELKMYDATVARELTPDCHTWIENGRKGVEPYSDARNKRSPLLAETVEELLKKPVSTEIGEHCQIGEPLSY